MKKIYVLLFVCLFVQWSKAQTINIPDSNFKNYLLTTLAVDTDNDYFWDSSIDINNDGEIQESEALLLTFINLNYLSITSLEGIQYFTNLQYLSCVDHRMNTLDLSQNVNLEVLVLSANGPHLTSLDVSQCTNLRVLDVSNNFGFPSLDVTQNPNLEKLDFSSCNITQIDVTQNPNLKEFDCSRNILGSLDVTQNPNLEELDCSFTSLTTLDVTQNLNLVDLDAYGNSLTTIDVTLNTQLEKLRIGSSQIVTTDLSQNVNLIRLDCSGDSFTSLDLSANVNLESLTLDDSQLTTIDLSNNVNLRLLYAFDGSFTSLDLSQNVNLERLSLYFNDLTSLDISNNPKLTEINLYENMLTSLDASNNPLLKKIGCTSNQLEYINIKNGINSSPSEFRYLGNPDLQYICADPGEVDFLSSSSFLTSTVVATYCSMTPGGAFTTLEGTATLDANSNGCEASDPVYPRMEYELTYNSTSETIIADASGDYTMYLPEDETYTITPQLENPTYFTVSPTSITVDTATASNPTLQDFCVIPNGTYNDVEVTIMPLEAARPGFDTNYKIVYTNKGNTVLSGNVQLTFDDALMDLVSANPMTDSQATNTLTWNYTNLAPFESGSIDFTMNINSPIEVPAVNGDDVLAFEATINPVVGDETPSDNIMVLQQTVVNSFDPNDISCLEGETVTTDYVDAYIHYLIRFENTGTASAVNVVVTDEIDTAKFDIATLKPVSSSHAMVTTIKNGNRVEFIFENINLPFNDATNDGYLVFKIKTRSNLTEGDTFANTADIYFDFNFPITTNTATTNISNGLRVSNQNLPINAVVMYPNPTKGTLFIKSPETIQSIEIRTMEGRLLKRIFTATNRTSYELDLSEVTAGIYLVNTVTNSRKIISKIVKE
ncbi:MAG: T9SS type A sorting domain-containing protein [Bacteroidota bacterium]